MTFNGEGNMGFDYSDVFCEGYTLTTPHLADVLQIAQEVEAENAPAPGATRIEKLARFVIMALDRQCKHVQSGTVAKFMTDDGEVVMVGSALFLAAQRTADGWIPLANPLGLATALIEATEEACGENW